MTRRDVDPVIDNLRSLLDEQERKAKPLLTSVVDDPTWDLLDRSGYLSIDVGDDLTGGDFLTACRVLQVCASSTATAGLPIGNALVVVPWLHRAVGFPSDRAPAAVEFDCDLTVTPSSGGMAVDGVVRSAKWAGPDSALLLSGRGADDKQLLIEIPARRPRGVSIQSLRHRGGIPSAAVTCEGVVLPPDNVRPITPDQARELHSRIGLSVTLQIAGALDRILRMTVEYAGLRVQFGKSIDQFQMVKSHLAALAGEASVAAAAAWSAATVIDAGPMTDLAHVTGLAARVRAAQAATAGSRVAHQLHGTMGVTQEHRLHVLTGLLWDLRDTGISEGAAQRELGRQLVAGGPEYLLQALTCD